MCPEQTRCEFGPSAFLIIYIWRSLQWANPGPRRFGASRLVHPILGSAIPQPPQGTQILPPFISP